MKLASILLIFLIVHVAHAVEPAAEGGEKPPKKTPGGFIELEIEGEEDKPAEPEAEQPAADESSDNSSEADSGDSGG